MMINKVTAIFANAARAGEVLRCRREVENWLPVTRAYLGFKDLQYPFSLRVPGLEPITIQEISDLWAFWQVFLRRVYSLDSRDRVIVDAGANIGFFTLFAAQRLPDARIVSVEPYPPSHERLTLNIRNNNFSNRVTPLNCALGARCETRVMRLASTHSQRRRVFSEGSLPGARRTTVLTKTLTQILQEENLEHVDLLKMDIEGSEYEVLFNTPLSVLQTIRRIALEYHPDIPGYTWKMLFGHLAEAGFGIKSDKCDKSGFGVAQLELRAETGTTRYAA